MQAVKPSDENAPTRAPHRHRMAEALATVRGASLLVGVLASPFLVLGAFSLAAILRGDALSSFAIGQATPFKFMGAGATYLNVLIFCAIGFLSVLAVVVLRYRHHREMVEFLRARGVTDYDRDGRRDSFADRFLDDL